MALRSQMQMQAQVQQQSQDSPAPPSQNIVISQANELTTVTDPFLGQTNSSDHSRQESGDSGVGKNINGRILLSIVNFFFFFFLLSVLISWPYNYLYFGQWMMFHLVSFTDLVNYI